MPDKECQDACKAAYASTVNTLFQKLFDCLVIAGETDEEARKRCAEAFRKGMKVAKEARDICIKACE